MTVISPTVIDQTSPYRIILRRNFGSISEWTKVGYLSFIQLHSATIYVHSHLNLFWTHAFIVCFIWLLFISLRHHVFDFSDFRLFLSTHAWVKGLTFSLGAPTWDRWYWCQRHGVEPLHTGTGLSMVFWHTRFLQVDSEEVSSWIIWAHFMPTSAAFCYMFLYIIHRFDIPRSVLHDSVTNVCNILLDLESTYVTWPNADAQECEAATFKHWTG